MKKLILGITLSVISISMYAQKTYISNIVGYSIFENNIVYGKIKTIENHSFISDTSFLTKIVGEYSDELRLKNYFLAFDTARNLTDKIVDNQRVYDYKASAMNTEKCIEMFDFHNGVLIRKCKNFTSQENYEKRKNYETYYKSNNVLYQRKFYLNNLGKVKKFEDFLDGKLCNRIHYKYDYDILIEIQKN